jgi:3-oxoacyl-[acyl-carrier protein] reductase
VNATTDPATGTKVAIVTGGSRGIGRACSLAFADAGYDVAIVYREAGKAADEVAEAVRGRGRRALTLRADLADAAVPERVIAETVSGLGRVDVLVCNAAVFDAGEVLTLTPEHFAGTIDINVRSSVFLTQAAARVMVGQGSGAIIHVLSGALQRPERGHGVYRMSKAAQLALVESAALELATTGVRVTAVVPGMTNTDMTAPDLNDPERRVRAMAAVPMGRPGEPAEVAAAAVFLASDAAQYITGSTITIDGGRRLGPV